MEEKLTLILDLLRANKQTIATMESCTGGFLANRITNISGASDVFSFGAVTYSNAYKIKMGVSKEVIDTYTVYSSNTAEEMAKSISNFTNATYGIGITGKINCADNGNQDGLNNVVYFSIYHKDTNTFINQTISLELYPREKCKQIIVDMIIIKLYDFLVVHMVGDTSC